MSVKIAFISVGHSKGEDYGSEMQRSARELQVLGIARELARNGHEVFIVRRWTKTNEQSIDGVRMINVGIPELPDNRIHQIPSLLMFSVLACKVVSKIKPDVFCIIDRISGYFPSRLSIPKVFVASTHDAFEFVKQYEIERNPINSVFFELKRRIEEGVMKRSNRVIALTPRVKEQLEARGIIGVSVIPNALEPSEFQNNGEGEFILAVGRLFEHKGFQYLLEAYAGLADDIHEKLIIVGSGPYEDELKRIMTDLRIVDRVEIIPFMSRRDYVQRLSRCRLFVFPSDYEAFGVVVIEAMASSKCVISSNIIGPGEILNDGVDGVLFEKSNVEELRTKISRCMNCDFRRREIGLAARKTVEDHYSFKSAAEKYIKIFEELKRG